jgi:hypothetical protein
MDHEHEEFVHVIARGNRCECLVFQRSAILFIVILWIPASCQEQGEGIQLERRRRKTGCLQVSSHQVNYK